MKSTYPKSSPGGSEDKESEYELEVLTAETNQSEHTYDGIDWGGERVIDEVCPPFSNSVSTLLSYAESVCNS